MAKVSAFRSEADADAYRALYDDLAEIAWPVPHVELDVPTRYGSTRVRRSGPVDGRSFVLLPPATGSSLAWRTFVAPLAATEAVYTPDTIGTPGRTVQTAPVTGPDDLAAWLDDVLDELGLDPVHLVGWSEGGWVAGAHAARTARPGRLASVALIDPAGAVGQIQRRVIAAMALRGLRVLRARDPYSAMRDFNRWLGGEIEMTDAEIDLVIAALRTFRQHLPIPRRLPDDQLRQLTAPTLLMLGGATRIYDAATVADRAGRLLPDVVVDITPGAGHNLPLQQATRVIDRIVAHASGEHPVPTT
jgi:pimeloyl-ACP methyl ester carboxylesterase